MGWLRFQLFYCVGRMVPIWLAGMGAWRWDRGLDGITSGTDTEWGRQIHSIACNTEQPGLHCWGTVVWLARGREVGRDELNLVPMTFRMIEEAFEPTFAR